jgi:cytochrome d ubiquinol oxidase subunit II
MEFTLPIVWALILAFSVLLYVILDGFDLGVGMLFGFAPTETHRRTYMNAVAPVWDGNETWLLVTGAGLFGAFPVVYSVLLPAFYLPLILMLIALVFRGVAFEFRYKTVRWRAIWDLGFIVGSFLAAFVQGAAVGAIVEGIPVADDRFAGGAFIWLSPFSVLCGLGLILGYMLLGATWLVFKTEGDARDWARRRVFKLLIAVLVFLVFAFIYVAVTRPDIIRLWIDRWPMLIFPIIGAVATIALVAALRQRNDVVPFLMTALIFVCAFGTLAVSFWPYMIPHSITISDAAAPTLSLEFMFYGAAIVVLPVMLIYTAVVYTVFHGKVGADEGYH